MRHNTYTRDGDVVPDSELYHRDQHLARIRKLAFKYNTTSAVINHYYIELLRVKADEDREMVIIT